MYHKDTQTYQYILKRFVLYPFKEIAKIFIQRGIRAVNERSCLSHIHISGRRNRYSIRRGSGLFISLIGVWRCLLEDKQEHHPTLFR